MGALRDRSPIAGDGRGGNRRLRPEAPALHGHHSGRRRGDGPRLGERLAGADDPSPLLGPDPERLLPADAPGHSARRGRRGTMLSNSSAMCIAPVGIVNAGNPRAATREALSVARLVHRGMSLDGWRAVAAAVAAALDPDASPETVISAATAHFPADSEMIPAITAGVALARESGGYEAFREAFYERLLRPWPDRDERPSTAVDPRESVPAALGIFLLAGRRPRRDDSRLRQLWPRRRHHRHDPEAIFGALRGACTARRLARRRSRGDACRSG